MPTYNTPGVFVEEISTFPPSVAQVATAIPAFIGFTEKSPSNPVARIDSLLDYENLFGKAKTSQFQVSIASNGLPVLARTDSDSNKFLLYYAVNLYFRNRGGSCYIVSVGSFKDTPSSESFEKGLDLLDQEDEPTLIVLSEAASLLSPQEYAKLGETALSHCAKLADRFLILDVPGGNIQGFRNDIGTSYLSYGAAYHPYLKTTLAYLYQEKDVKVPGEGPLIWTSGESGITVTRPDSQSGAVWIQSNGDKTTIDFDTQNADGTLAISIPSSKTKGKEVFDAWQKWNGDIRYSPSSAASA